MQLPQDAEPQAGLATRRAVLGDDYVQAALDKATPFTAPLQELVTRHAWGNTWQRKGIDLRTRSIATVSMLVALGRMHELKIHVRGALNNGVTPQELQEIFLHASVYCVCAAEARRLLSNEGLPRQSRVRSGLCRDIVGARCSHAHHVGSRQAVPGGILALRASAAQSSSLTVL